MVDGQALWAQIVLLLVAFVLSALIGWERQVRQKSAGLRTHTLVGVGAALFMVISKYGFWDVLGPHVLFDPSRVASNIVTGIGFIGGGLIFVHREIVRGLTTASVVWITAAIGAAAGAGLVVIAVVVTALHFVVILGLTPVRERLPSPEATSRVDMTYAKGSGALRQALVTATDRGFAVQNVSVAERDEDSGQAPNVNVSLLVQGTGSASDLTADLSELSGVRSVSVGSTTGTDE